MVHSRLVVKNQSVFQIYSIVQKDEFMEIRENRVVILGAGIGAMAMGFENASCKVVAAYEHDERARDLYENNAKDKTYKIGELDYNNFEEIPDMDILACDFRRGFSFTPICKFSTMSRYSSSNISAKIPLLGFPFASYCL